MELERKIRGKSATIGIAGMGYVGLPLAASFAKAGFRVVGVDYCDPYVPKARAGRRRWSRKTLTDSLVKKSDLVVILTAHPGVDYARNATAGVEDPGGTPGDRGRVERL